jgi:hypothetical protein
MKVCWLVGGECFPPSVQTQNFSVCFSDSSLMSVPTRTAADDPSSLPWLGARRTEASRQGHGHLTGERGADEVGEFGSVIR